MLRLFEHVERMDEGRWLRKFKAATGVGQQRRGKPRLVWLSGWDEKCFSCQEGRVAGGNATRERKECVERTC